MIKLVPIKPASRTKLNSQFRSQNLVCVSKLLQTEADNFQTSKV